MNVHIVMTIFFSNKYLTYDHAHLLNHAHIRRITEYSEKMEPNIRKCKTRGLDSPSLDGPPQPMGPGAAHRLHTRSAATGERSLLDPRLQCQ